MTDFKNLTMKDFGFKPVLTCEDFNKIDEKECADGYFRGLKGDIAETNKTRSYYHGYLNGLNDSGRRELDDNQKRMVLDVKEKSDFIQTRAELLNLFVLELSDEKVVIH